MQNSTDTVFVFINTTVPALRHFEYVRKFEIDDNKHQVEKYHVLLDHTLQLEGV